MWPAIAKIVWEKVRASSADIVIIDAALLAEAGWDKEVDQLWTVFVPREEATRRMVERDGLAVEQVPSTPLLIHLLGGSPLKQPIE